MAIILSACSYNYDSDVGNIEKLLNVDLKKYDYEVKSPDYGISFGQESVILILSFKDKDFELFLNKLNMNKWEKENLEDEYKGCYDYSFNHLQGSVKIWMFLNLKEKKLKYSYYED